jgi:hypothetical protein
VFGQCAQHPFVAASLNIEVFERRVKKVSKLLKKCNQVLAQFCTLAVTANLRTFLES